MLSFGVFFFFFFSLTAICLLFYGCGKEERRPQEKDSHEEKLQLNKIKASERIERQKPIMVILAKVSFFLSFFGTSFLEL